MKNLELVKIVEENKLDKTQGQIILDNFTGFFKEAEKGLLAIAQKIKLNIKNL